MNGIPSDTLNSTVPASSKGASVWQPQEKWLHVSQRKAPSFDLANVVLFCGDEKNLVFKRFSY